MASRSGGTGCRSEDSSLRGTFWTPFAAAKSRLAIGQPAPTGARNGDNRWGLRRDGPCLMAKMTDVSVPAESSVVFDCPGQLGTKSSSGRHGATLGARLHRRFVLGDPPCRLLLAVVAENCAMAFVQPSTVRRINIRSKLLGQALAPRWRIHFIEDLINTLPFQAPGLHAGQGALLPYRCSNSFSVW